MPNKLAVPRRATGQEPTRWSFFGPPPLMKGENPAAYDELLARVTGAVKPADILEEFWVRDIVDLVWEALRLRRLKADLIAANAHKGLQEILAPLCDWSSPTCADSTIGHRQINALAKKLALHFC